MRACTTVAFIGLIAAALLAPAAARGQAKTPRIVLRWTAVAEAKKYELEIAADREFEQVVVSETVPLNGYRWRAAPKSAHYFRVRSIDAEGRKGEWSRPKEIAAVKLPEPVKPKPEPVEEKPPPDPPELVHPTGGESVAWQSRAKPRVRLSWNERPEVSSYQVQVASDRGFDRGVVRYAVRETQKTFRPSRMGPFFWRVRCAQPKSEWSAIGSFRVVPAAPVPDRPQDGAAFQLAEQEQKAAVALGWQEVPHATGYEVTLRAEPAEGEPAEGETVVQRVEGETSTMAELGAGRFSWSVRALHRRAASSAPSEPRVFEITAPALPEPAVEVPPVEDEPEPEPVVRKEPVLVDEEPEEPEPMPAYLHIAPRIGFVYNLGEVVAPRFEGEIGGRLPLIDRRLGLIVSGGYYTVTTEGPDAELSFESRLKVVPIEATALFSFFPNSSIDLYVGAGVAVDLVVVSVQVPTQPLLEESRVQVGPVALLGAESRLGPGRFFLQVNYQLNSPSDEGIGATDPGGLGAALGYRLDIIR